MLGLGLGLSKGTNLLSNLKLLTRNSDWAIWGDKASGQSFPTLAERTLPNGVKNDAHLKRVSDDVVIGTGIVVDFMITTYTGTDYANIEFTNASVFEPFIDGKLVIENRSEIANTELDTNTSLHVFYTNLNVVWISVPKGTTLEQARTLLAGTVIRYQLATPVDTLNSPQVNPIQDLVGTADGTLQGFAFTPASGYVDVVAPNGKTVTGVQGDGVNDVVLLPSNAPNPVGLDEFFIGLVVKTGSSLTSGQIVCRNSSSTSDVQYAIQLISDGRIAIYLEGTANYINTIGTIQPNSFYKVRMKRVGGRLVGIVDEVEGYNAVNTANITSRPNTRLFARSSSVDGSTNTSFSNVWLGAIDIKVNNVVEAEADFNKFCAKVYGL